MTGIRFTHHGDFSKLQRYLERCKNSGIGELDRYGEAGVEALREATPKDSGKTAQSWTYQVVRERNCIRIEWLNTNVVDGVCVAVVLQYGHATRSGSWVEGTDYINPAIRPIFEKIANDVWREVSGS